MSEDGQTGGEEAAPEPSKKMSLLDLVPKDWITSGTTSVWMREYRAFRVTIEELKGGIAPADRPLDLAIAVIWGEGVYFKPGHLTLKSETDWHFDPPGDFEPGPEGAYLFLIAPFGSLAGDGDEPATVDRLDAAAGALAAICGRDGVFELVAEFELHVDGRRTTRGPMWVNPLAFEPPRIGQRRALALGLLARVFASGAEQRRKTELSLRWLESATRSDGVDAFLKYWIALETLCMTAYGDYRPVVAFLARAYGLSPSTVGVRFAIGRMLGLRGRILHHGKQPPIHGTLLRYMEAIYGDVILEMYGLPHLHRAADVLGDGGFSVVDALNIGT